MKTQIILSAAFAFCVFAAQAQTTDPARQNISGSDTLAGAMTDALTASGLNSVLNYVGGGSAVGEKAMLNGEQGIAPMSRPVKPEAMATAKTKNVTFIPHVIGLDGLGIFVNHSNPTRVLDLATLKSIFTCQITQWEQVAGSPFKGPIKVYRRNDVSGTTDLFKQLVGITGFGPCVSILAETTDIATKTSTETEAIAYAGLSAKRDTNHALALAKTSGTSYVEPTAANVRNFTYPLARKLFVYTISGATNPNKNEAAFMKYVLDRSFMDPILQDNEFITID